MRYSCKFMSIWAGAERTQGVNMNLIYIDMFCQTRCITRFMSAMQG